MSANKNKSKSQSNDKQKQNFLQGLILVEDDKKTNSEPIKELNATLASITQNLSSTLNTPIAKNDSQLPTKPMVEIKQSLKEEESISSMTQSKVTSTRKEIISEISAVLSSLWYISSAVVFDSSSIVENNPDSDINIAVKFIGFYNNETMLIGNSMVELMESLISKIRSKHPNKINIVVLSKDMHSFYEQSGFLEIGTVLFDRQEVDITLKCDKTDTKHHIDYESIYALGSEYDRGFKTYCIINLTDNMYKVVCFKGENALYIAEFLYNRNTCRLKIQEKHSTSIDESNETNTVKYIFKNKRYLIHTHLEHKTV